ncbi:MAG TPA: hypothetical protein VMW68_02740 [Methyloceanibacter sp.]|nr:hypothetical protein [Methyloceanibacter sp.]
MISTTADAWRFCAAALAIVASALLAQPASARDGMSGCSLAEAEADGKRVWRYTVELLVPQGGHCRVYVSEDLDRKSWKYCWLKDASQNPVSATCDDPLDDEDFVDWKAKAVCGGQTFMAYCRREP